MKFQSLDTLRGLAALTVAIFHFSPTWAGYVAVDFFLVLSGFVLSHSYLYKDEPIKPVEFISHRVARLYPLHLFTLMTFILVYYLIARTLPIYKDGGLFVFIQNLTLTQNIGFNSSGFVRAVIENVGFAPGGFTFNYPNWSISVEFWINILFILFITRKTKSSIIFFIALIGLLVIHGNSGNLDVCYTNYYSFINTGMIRGVSSFFLGILAYRIYLFYRNGTRGKKHITLLEIIGVIGVLLIIFARDGKHSGLDFVAPFWFMFIVVIFSFEQGYIAKSINPLKYLGEISYSIYLNQLTVLMLVRYTLHEYELSNMTMLFAFLILLVIVSHFTYQYIEKPLRNRGRDVLTRMTTP